jgi:CspA family cold shock protein
MAQGVVKWFDEKKGYGFITAPDGGPDIFVHYSGIQGEGFRTLTEGEPVQFTMVVSEKGPKAEHVVRLNPPAAVPTPPQRVVDTAPAGGQAPVAAPPQTTPPSVPLPPTPSPDIVSPPPA